MTTDETEDNNNNNNNNNNTVDPKRNPPPTSRLSSYLSNAENTDVVEKSRRKCSRINNGKVEPSPETIAKEILNDLLDRITENNRGDVSSPAVTKRDRINRSKSDTKILNRKTRLLIMNDSSFESEPEPEEESNRDSLYSLEEHDEESAVHDGGGGGVKKIVKTDPAAINHKLIKEKSAKGWTFGASFKKKSKSDEGPTKNETKKEKPSPLTRTPSFSKTVKNFFNKEGPKLLRSFSFRDINKRREKEKSRDKLSEMKNQEWASSLQSLVENDLGISYKDLSFIDYDVHNRISYENRKKFENTKRSLLESSSSPVQILQRASSLHENGSFPVNRVPNLSRGTSFPRHYQSTIDLSESGALSLPSLQHLHSKENVGTFSPSVDEENDNLRDRTTQKYRPRHSSVCSEDGVNNNNNNNKCRPIGNGSFKTTGNGSSKLKRHNACRQKTRDSTTAITTVSASTTATNSHDHQNNQDDNVRSKSLNHLDEIEMKQAVESSSDSDLKDSRSEPDCAKTLLAPPGRANSSTPEPPPTTDHHPPNITTIDQPTVTKKHVLSRSQKSSSECFSVNFEVGDETTWDNELFFPAVRGVTLNDSLSKLCELRNIDLTSCDAWLQDKDSNTNAWLSFSQDTACLVGKHVRITAKDLLIGNKKYSGNHSRKPSTTQNSKSRTSSFFSSSIEDGTSSNSNIPVNSLPPQDSRLSLQDYELGKKQTKQRWSGFFSNNKDTKMELLSEQLNNYAKNGIPNCQIYPQGQCESIDALYKLETDWREIVDCNDLAERLQQQQTALWELIKTEVAYIKTLKVVTDLFLACLKNLQSVNLLKEIDTEKLFSNITEILDANVLFWRNCMFPLVKDMRRYRQPPCIENMLQGFLKIEETFQAYFRYCAEQARCQHYCRETHTHNELFTAYLVWCETQKDCNRLKLMDILVQPMQRLTKYGLLLKAILRNTDDDVERDNLNLMIKSVDDFVNNVNLSLKQKQDNERLKGIMARIESYDAVESKDDDLEKLLKAYSQLDLNRPMIGCPPERKRHLLLEGDLKLKDSSASKMEVHCFLLTDMLLVCKPSTKKGGATMRIIRQPYLIDRLAITELTRETPSLALIYKNEFDLPVAAFILQNNDVRKLKSWKDSIVKAQSLYTQAKQTNYVGEEGFEQDYAAIDYTLEGDYHSLQLAPRSPLASSSRASRVSSLAHSHSGSVEMNDQSSIGSANQSRAVSMENENRTASISSDEGVQPLPPDNKSPVSQKLSFKHRLFNKTPNTLSVQPYSSNLGQSLPNLTLGSPNVGTLNLNLSQNTLSVPHTKNGGHLLSPTHRGVSYPPPSPTRGNLKRGLAISQNKNPPLIKTRHVTSTASSTVGSGGGGGGNSGQVPTSFDFDVPVIAGISPPDDSCENFSRGQHRQAMLKRIRNDNKRYHTAGVVDDIKHNDSKDPGIHKRLSWNCSSSLPPSQTEPDNQT